MAMADTDSSATFTSVVRSTVTVTEHKVLAPKRVTRTVIRSTTRAATTVTVTRAPTTNKTVVITTTVAPTGADGLAGD